MILLIIMDVYYMLMIIYADNCCEFRISAKNYKTLYKLILFKTNKMKITNKLKNM